MNDNWNSERKLVYYLLAFNDSKSEQDRNSAMKWLKKVSEYYHVNLKQKAVKTTLYDALIMFLRNDKSMDENLNRIFSILNKKHNN